jgi:hypothetical protein
MMISDKLKDHIRQTLAEWEVPGCAIAIVEKDAEGKWRSAVEAFGSRDDDLPMTTKVCLRALLVM